VQRHGRAVQPTGINMARAHCMMNTQGYKRTLRIRNAYCFTTATTVTRSRLNVTFYVHGLSFLFHLLLFRRLSLLPVLFNHLLHCEHGWQYELGSEGLLDCTDDECRS
jgi:hypothetical protein